MYTDFMTVGEFDDLLPANPVWHYYPALTQPIDPPDHVLLSAQAVPTVASVEPIAVASPDPAPSDPEPTTEDPLPAKHLESHEIMVAHPNLSTRDLSPCVQTSTPTSASPPASRIMSRIIAHPPPALSPRGRSGRGMRAYPSPLPPVGLTWHLQPIPHGVIINPIP